MTHQQLIDKYTKKIQAINDLIALGHENKSDLELKKRILFEIYVDLIKMETNQSITITST